MVNWWDIDDTRWSCIFNIIQQQKGPQKMTQVVGTELI